MSTQQLVLSVVLAAMVFSVALELRVEDFRRVLRMPRSVACGLIPQFVLLPVGTWAATLVLDLPANIEVAMLLIAACPGGSVSNYIVHYGRGNTALSVSVSAAGSVMALFLTPFNFAWMIASNPGTAAWLREIDIDPSGVWVNLLVLLALPLSLGLLVAHYRPVLGERMRRPLGKFSLVALVLFIVAGLAAQRSNLTAQRLPELLLAMAHNGAGMLLGWLTATAMRVPEGDRRAVTIEGGFQSGGLALAIVAVQFNSDLGMVLFTSMWAIWQIVSGMSCAMAWRYKDGRNAVSRSACQGPAGSGRRARVP